MATLKQKLAVKKISDNIGNMGEAMRAAGYSASTSKTPRRLTDSKGFKELFNQILPDDLLLKKHKELLTTPIKTKTLKKGKIEVVEESLDAQAVKAGLEMAYRIKGYYSATKISQQITTGLEHLSDEDIDRLLVENEPILARYKKYCG